MKIWQ